MTMERASGAQPPSRLPTLTEELQGPVRSEPQAPPRLTEVLQAPPGETGSPTVDPAAIVRRALPATTAASAEQDNALAQRLLADMQQHLDRVLEARMAAAIEPLLEQLSTRLLEQARGELASSLREAMAVALARELARHRAEPGPR